MLLPGVLQEGLTQKKDLDLAVKIGEHGTKRRRKCGVERVPPKALSN